jgi:NitT/TauT family transport system permease protein
LTRPLRWLAGQLPALVIFAVFILLWQLAVSFLDVREYLLPSPGSVLRAMFGDEIPWGRHIWVTGVEIVGAFGVAGLAGGLVGMAIAPLFLMWMGYGILPNVLIGALIGFFPVVINTAVGLTQIEQDLIDLGRVFDAPKWKVFVKIRVPNAYPYILSALKITATAAVVGAIVGEFVASQRGLGYVIITTQSSMNTPVAFAALVWISVLGLVLFGFVAALSRLLVPWANEA